MPNDLGAGFVVISFSFIRNFDDLQESFFGIRKVKRGDDVRQDRPFGRTQTGEVDRTVTGRLPVVFTRTGQGLVHGEADAVGNENVQRSYGMTVMRKKLRGFTLIELLVVIAIIALLISILLPSLSRARELSKRLVCGSNTKGIGTSCKIYANDNNERWPVPPFEASATRVGGQGIKYTSPGSERAGVGYSINFPSTSATSVSTRNGTSSLSVTRAFWMLVRSGDVTVKQFICPSSGDIVDTTDNIEVYYDFQTIDNISYGYQVPWGPRDTVPREGMDNRAALIADKGPYSTNCDTPDFLDPAQVLLTQKSGPKDWRRFNSNNHGGGGNGEGQNVLFADGHSSFEKKPIVGIDNDNIYTLQTPEWDVQRKNLIHGEPPCRSTLGTDPFPGQGALSGNAWTSTDSMIWP